MVLQWEVEAENNRDLGFKLGDSVAPTPVTHKALFSCDFDTGKLSRI